jgi:hypothetical protein
MNLTICLSLSVANITEALLFLCTFLWGDTHLRVSLHLNVVLQNL